MSAETVGRPDPGCEVRSRDRLATTWEHGSPHRDTAQPERAPRAVRVLGMAAVCVGLAALAGGTFVLSYSGIHAMALHSGIAPRLARGYPLLIDAMLVIVLAAVLALRGADLASRLLAWTTLLAVLAAAAGADALHAVGRRLPRHPAAITAAVLPWVLLFLAFALLLAMLRHARLRRLAASAPLPAAHFNKDEDPQPSATGAAAIVPGLELPALQPQVDQPAQDEQAAQADEADEVDEADETAARAHQAEPAEQATELDEPDDPDMPVFHRMWSSPTPPEPSA
jgi:hypothetical protein